MNSLSLSPVLQSVSVVFMGFHQDRTFVTSSYSLTTFTSVTGLLPSTMHLVTVTAAYNEPGCSSIYETYAIKTNSEDDIGLSMLVWCDRGSLLRIAMSVVMSSISHSSINESNTLQLYALLNRYKKVLYLMKIFVWFIKNIIHHILWITCYELIMIPFFCSCQSCTVPSAPKQCYELCRIEGTCVHLLCQCSYAHTYMIKYRVSVHHTYVLITLTLTMEILTILFLYCNTDSSAALQYTAVFLGFFYYFLCWMFLPPSLMPHLYFTRPVTICNPSCIYTEVPVCVNHTRNHT